MTTPEHSKIFNMAHGDEILRERINLREQILMQQADALDVKASILLVAVTFLAGHSMYLLSQHPNVFVRWDQRLSVVLQIVAGIVLAMHLRIRSYQGEKTQEYPKWRDDLVGHYGASERDQVENELNKGVIGKSVERLAEAESINYGKARAIGWAYWITLAAFFCNLAALVSMIIPGLS